MFCIENEACFQRRRGYTRGRIVFLLHKYLPSAAYHELLIDRISSARDSDFDDTIAVSDKD